MIDEYSDFITHLTDNAKTCLYHANVIAQGYGSSYIGTEHLLLGILVQGSSVGAKILADADVTLDQVQMALNLTPITVMVGPQAKALSETAKLTLKMGWDIAKSNNQTSFGTEHILYSLLNQKNSRANVLLKDMGVNIAELSDALESFITQQPDDGGDIETSSTSTKASAKSRGGALGAFGVDLTDKARDGLLDPVVGRGSETERLATILSRRTKNNPVLIGEPGVGKTAIVEGLAERIVAEDVSDQLLDKRIIQIDLSSMIAGTKYRGEFEDRFKRLINEAKQQGNIILFIDELHLLVGAGAAEGTIDAANMLKPALARGEVHLIGATTLDEYRKHIEKDSALSRRFQSIIVEEPSLKDTILIIRSLRSSYEKYHGIKISNEVIETAVRMSDRYISDRFMPDKAIDVIDEAAALMSVRSGISPNGIKNIMREIRDLNSKTEEAVSNENYEKAALYKTRVSQLSSDLEKLRQEMKQKKTLELTDDNISQAIANITHIPIQRLKKSEAKMLTSLEKYLGKYIIGQREAISKVSAAIRRSRSGVSSTNRPIGSFVFMGPTGVGKTELAKVLAREVFGSEKSLIKIDMSEFGERHNTSRLLGAPAGYVGYDDANQLTDRVYRQPYSVVLFDEIEKAHHDVLNILLQILEDGAITDARGRKVDFTNTIVILTSNLGSDHMSQEATLGFRIKSKDDEKKLDQLHDENANMAISELEKIMRPELINRLDDVITFRALTRKQVGKILDLQLKDLQNRLISKGLHLVVKPSAKRILIDKGYSERFGARPLRRAVQNEIEHSIACGILSGKFEKGSVLDIMGQKGEVKISVSKEK